MKTKKTKVPSVELSGQFEVKAVEKGAVIIEGLANVPVVDRGKDVIKADAWDLTNFMKNPVILFNHGNDADVGAKPVGKALEVKATDQGLWLRVRMTTSKGEVLQNIVDLVKEGNLVAFSVGFDPTESHREGDKNIITKAELYEVSIVAVPMNQESLFRVVSKAKKLEGFKDGTGVLKLPAIAMSLVKAENCRAKGAWIAGAIHTRIFDLQTEGQDRTEILTQLQEATGLDDQELVQFLAGNVTPTPDNVLSGSAEVLGLDPEALIELDKADEAVSGGGDSDEEVQEPAEGEETEPEATGEEGEESEEAGDDEELGADSEEDEDPEEGEKDTEEDKPELSQLGAVLDIGMKAFGLSRKALAEELEITETKLYQIMSGEIENPGEKIMKSLEEIMSMKFDFEIQEPTVKDLIVETIPIHIEKGQDPDSAVGLSVALAMKVKGERPSSEDYSFFFKIADRHFKGDAVLEKNTEESPEITEASSEEVTEEKADQPKLENEPDTGSIKQEDTPADLGNPLIDAVIAGNALMGTLINEVKLLRAMMEGGSRNATITEDPAPIETEEAAEVETVKQAPTEDMSDEELRSAREARSKEFGIEIDEDSSLSFPAGFPEELTLYGDPVNLKFPIDSTERSENARARFKQSADEVYQEDRSKAVVHARIVGRLLALGVNASFDPEDSLDALLPDDLKQKLDGSDEEKEDLKKFDSYLHGLSERLKRVE